MTELTLAEIKAARHRLVVPANFDERYDSKGGAEKLLEMADTGSTQRQAGIFSD
jgi:hypothetical protein